MKELGPRGAKEASEWPACLEPPYRLFTVAWPPLNTTSPSASSRGPTGLGRASSPCQPLGLGPGPFHTCERGDRHAPALPLDSAHLLSLGKGQEALGPPRAGFLLVEPGFPVVSTRPLALAHKRVYVRE